MAQKLEQYQEMTQTQSLAPQQIMFVRLLELPLNDLEDRVKNELVDNEALEEGGDNDELFDHQESEEVNSDSDDKDSFEEVYDNPSDNVIDSMSDFLTTDDIPDYIIRRADAAQEREEIPYRSTISFYEVLKQQMMECDLTEEEQYLMEYLIGSLDVDGLMHKKLFTIADELFIYHNIEVEVSQLEHLLKKLQTFEPVGIAATSLQECLLLQLKNPDFHSDVKELSLKVINSSFDDFLKNRWDKIQRRLKVEDETLQKVRYTLLHLNPRPGGTIGDNVIEGAQPIVPDFIVESDTDGNLSVLLNNGDVPELHISNSFKNSLNDYIKNKHHLSRQQKDALIYTKQKVDAAQGFINAIKQRQQTLYAVMSTIVKLQRPFFEDGDESVLKPMILKDIADRIKLDISTVSRVTGSKYVQTDFGIYPLKFFFSNLLVNDEGEELSTRKIKSVLKQVIEAEDKKKPLTDETLAKILNDKGLKLARRTVAKYREQLNIPVARLRRQ